MTTAKYPFAPGQITKLEAVHFIAKVVYPHLNATDGRKRVRSRITYGQQQKELPAGDCIHAPDLFRWALQKKGWGALARVTGLPVASSTFEASVTEVVSATCTMDAFVIPGDPQRLRDAYCRSETERMALAEENARLGQRVADLEAECEGWREKDRMLREQRRRAGRLGGRGKARW